MIYSTLVSDACEKSIEKLCKKNSVLREALEKKMGEIIENPQHYKPLKYGLAGEKRVHIMKSFVLRFEIDETRKTVVFIAFSHHDDVYKR